jgi:hypothetical protein
MYVCIHTYIYIDVCIYVCLPTHTPGWRSYSRPALPSLGFEAFVEGIFLFILWKEGFCESRAERCLPSLPPLGVEVLSHAFQRMQGKVRIPRHRRLERQGALGPALLTEHGDAAVVNVGWILGRQSQKSAP